ncbi:ATP-dependent helicase [Paraburkholderia megapolitana]|uniref:ATP-dependent helicase n=1 Tax=Paraburkholderia megapolitana TaxID=420953 RepID=UPI0038BB4BEC
MLDGLNPAQLEVVLCGQHCLAVACPGAGKTRTIASKAAHCLADPARRVGAVTFSRDAAVELRDRILALAGKNCKPRLKAGTFHSLAFAQISAGGKRRDVASDGDRSGIVARVLGESGVSWTLEEAVQVIERIKTDFGRVQEGTDDARLYHAYQEALARNGKIDFQDMLRLAVAGMDSGDIEPYALTDLLVDEFQDTDPLQYRWIEHHARAGATVTVVGDDDQSIYGFRAALGYRGMETFASMLDARRVVLGSNYRCHGEILAAADAVIRNNAERIPKVLHAEKGPGGTVAVLRFEDEYDEAVAAIEMLQSRLAADTSGAVLARTNRILDPLEAVCRSHGVSYYRASGYSVLSRPEGALMCNLFEIIQQSKTNGLDAVLAFAGMGTSDLSALHDAMGPSLIQRQKKDIVALGLSDETATAYRAFIKRLAEWQGLCTRQLYSLVLEGVREWMLGFAKKDAAIRAIVATYDVLSRLNGPFNERIAFMKRENNQPRPGAMVLTTMHSSKGLEWDHVWMIRAEESVVPDEKSPESEERRLFYVAMSRARQTLTISSTRKNPVSRFTIESGALDHPT